MVVAPSGNIYSTGRGRAVPSGLSTTFGVARALLKGLSTGFPRSVRTAGPADGGARSVVGGAGETLRVRSVVAGSSGRAVLALRWRRHNKTPEGTAEPVASDACASTCAVAFVLVAPSGKTYVRGSGGRCLARLSTSFEVRGRFSSTLSTGFPRLPGAGPQLASTSSGHDRAPSSIGSPSASI
jgi:hypothetical protein